MIFSSIFVWNGFRCVVFLLSLTKTRLCCLTVVTAGIFLHLFRLLILALSRVALAHAGENNGWVLVCSLQNCIFQFDVNWQQEQWLVVSLRNFVTMRKALFIISGKKKKFAAGFVQRNLRYRQVSYYRQCPVFGTFASRAHVELVCCSFCAIFSYARLPISW